MVTSTNIDGTAPNKKVIEAKGDGQLPPIFIPEGTYTVHITVDDGTNLAGYPAEGMTFGSGAAMSQKLLELEAEIDELRKLGA